MARKCAISGKGVMFGNNVSHAKNKTRRTFRPNIQSATLMSDVLGVKVRLKLTTQGLRTIEHNGGLDAYLLNTGSSRLTVDAVKLKRRIQRAKVRADQKAAA